MSRSGARACIRGGARGRFFNVVDLVNKLEAEGAARRSAEKRKTARREEAGAPS
jgi:hypothetical protein